MAKKVGFCCVVVLFDLGNGKATRFAASAYLRRTNIQEILYRGGDRRSEPLALSRRAQ
jgi:hypothetical protein